MPSLKLAMFLYSGPSRLTAVSPLFPNLQACRHAGDVVQPCDDGKGLNAMLRRTTMMWVSLSWRLMCHMILKMLLAARPASGCQVGATSLWLDSTACSSTHHQEVPSKQGCIQAESSGRAGKEMVRILHPCHGAATCHKHANNH